MGPEGVQISEKYFFLLGMPYILCRTHDNVWITRISEVLD